MDNCDGCKKAVCVVPVQLWLSIAFTVQIVHPMLNNIVIQIKLGYNFSVTLK